MQDYNSIWWSEYYRRDFIWINLLVELFHKHEELHANVWIWSKEASLDIMLLLDMNVTVYENFC